ncbi:thioredoxin 1 [[Emmonsia] crescens]|uniref:Thioredoxin 1 n=1 Tax=[Emmonsia] crescens TaxID=73230 RepID=A0A0G2HWS7_9EURO|nr:thioredoxin 1 [Emmonsia crescens UAMH 3008]
MFPKTSLRAVHQRRLLPLQPLPYNPLLRLPPPPPPLYNNNPPASTVASLRPLSLLRTSTTSRFITLSPLQKKSPFTSSARNNFRPTSGTMVVHNLRDRAAFESAVSSTDAAAAATATPTGQKTPLIVIDCFATWCGPCKAIAPKLVEFSEAYPNVGFYKVDVDECPDIAQELGVRAMPTFIFFKDGQKVDEVLGAVPPAIEAVIKKHAS